MIASEKIGSQHSIYLLAVIGWRMPHVSGYELALYLSKIDPEIKIILFSAWDYANKMMGQVEGVNWGPHYVTDPLRLQDMPSDLANFLMGPVVGAKFDHLDMPISREELLEAINNKIKNGKI